MIMMAKRGTFVHIQRIISQLSGMVELFGTLYLSEDDDDDDDDDEIYIFCLSPPPPPPSFGLVMVMMMMMMNYFSVERDGGAFWHSLLIRGAREGGRSNSYRQISGCDIIL